MALVINGERVDDAVLAGEFSSIKAYFESLGNVSCCERDDEFRGYARQNVVARVLLAQHAREVVPAPVADEVDAALARMKEAHGGEGQFYAALGAAPEDDHFIRENLETTLRVDQLVAGLVGEVTAPEEELRRLYHEQSARFMTVERVRASHISKAIQRGEQREAVYDEFRAVRRQLLAGTDFDELARAHSDRGSDLVDLGFFTRGNLPEEFDFVAFSMGVGEVSPVFSSPAGFHIVKVTGCEPATPKPFEEVRDEVARLHLEQRRQERVRELVKDLEGRATIEEVAEAPEYAEPA